jgi:hypothetical protein
MLELHAGNVGCVNRAGHVRGSRIRRRRAGYSGRIATRTLNGTRMKFESPRYEFPIEDIKWTGAIGQPAGIYWFGDRTVMVAQGSAAEDWLIDNGAIPVATLLFGPDPLERSHRGRTVEALHPEAVYRAARYQRRL